MILTSACADIVSTAGANRNRFACRGLGRRRPEVCSFCGSYRTISHTVNAVDVYLPIIPTNDLSFHPASLTSLSLLLFLFLLILFDRARAVLIAVKVLFCDNGSKFSRHRGRRSVVTLAPKQQLSPIPKGSRPRETNPCTAQHIVLGNALDLRGGGNHGSPGGGHSAITTRSFDRPQKAHRRICRSYPLQQDLQYRRRLSLVPEGFSRTMLRAATASLRLDYGRYQDFCPYVEVLFHSEASDKTGTAIYSTSGLATSLHI